MDASAAILPSMWALANLLMAKYGADVHGYVKVMTDDAKRKGDHELLRIWQDVSVCLNKP